MTVSVFVFLFCVGPSWTNVSCLHFDICKVGCKQPESFIIHESDETGSLDTQCNRVQLQVI